jgi:ubiquinone/menaquinone biosynthesis C-methylase UbiE
MDRARRFYDERAEEEWHRLEGHRTEFAVTMRVLDDYLPPAPARVLDVGGGPGRYAIELGRRGYCVTLVDVSGKCLQLARKKAQEAGVKLSGVVQANALCLSQLGDETYDAVLILGPLYHLLREQDRKRAVSEAFRVLRLGGVVFASFITRSGVLRYAAKLNPEWVLTYGQELLDTGLPADCLVEGSFPACFFHPDQVMPLMEEAGFDSLDLVGCEGVVARLEERVNGLTGELWETWTDINYRVGHDPTLLGASDHLVYAGRKLRLGN